MWSFAAICCSTLLFGLALAGNPGFSWVTVEGLPANWTAPRIYFAELSPHSPSPKFEELPMVMRGAAWVGTFPAFPLATFVIEHDRQWWLHCATSATPDGASCYNTTNGVNFRVAPGNFTVSTQGCTVDATACLGSIARVSKGNQSCPAGPDATNDFSGNVTFTRGGTQLSAGSTAQCSNNGACTTVLSCACNGDWSGANCSKCSCAGNSWCEAGSGRCVTEKPTSAPTALQQGVVVVLVDVRAYKDRSWRETAIVYGNINSLSTSAAEWEVFNTRCVSASSAYDEAVIPNRSAYTNCNVWRVAILPTNAAVFVINSEKGHFFSHCASVEGVSASGARCVADHHDEQDNFLAYAGAVSIVAGASLQAVPMRVLAEYNAGCQWGAPGQPAASEALPRVTDLMMCNGNGTCGLGTAFSCACRGNYTGVSCAACSCRGMHEECAAATGSCACRNGYQRCSRGECRDVMNDASNCGGCGKDCYDGQQHFIRNATCHQGQCSYEYNSRFLWTICFGSKQKDGRQTDIACFKGYSFVIIAVVAGLLCVVCLWCWRQYRVRCPHTHQHRRLLFFLLAVIGAIRMGYALIAIVIISTIHSPGAAAEGEAFFKDSMVTLNAFGDLFTGMVDLLLTVFWLFVLQRLQSFPRRALGFWYFGMFFTLLVATIIDYQVRPLTFNYTFFTIAIILFFTAMLHLCVVVEVLMKIRQWRKIHNGEESPLLQRRGVTAGAPPALSQVRVYRHFVRVAAIASVCFVCWLFRSVMLLGRATRKPLFISGSLSFANPEFTLCYYTVLSLLPCIIIAVAFFALSFDVLVGTSAAKSESDSPDPSPERSERTLLANNSSLERVVPMQSNNTD